MARAVVIQRLKPFEVIAKACLGCLGGTHEYRFSALRLMSSRIIRAQPNIDSRRDLEPMFLRTCRHPFRSVDN
jgi:hypothetical protein